MWAFHGNFWAKRDNFWGPSYLKAHPLGNRCPECGIPTYTRTVDRIRTRTLGDPSDPKAGMVPLCPNCPVFKRLILVCVGVPEVTRCSQGSDATPCLRHLPRHGLS
ncbi:hypothetical protein E2C01_059675 [Portunus trituberculatus]|uniref:Uncharacterized protein n=1 Tax=Portunus trituberculatus TaxID=210409 RepID=A0A5B7H919_PORTR|nr:hypothetical protein [Portunus trituberculatus]